MALEATVIPRDGRVNSKGKTISFIAGDDLSLDDYSLYVDHPCHIRIEPVPSAVDDEWEIDGEALEEG